MRQLVVKFVALSLGVLASTVPLACRSSLGYSSIHRTTFGESASTVARTMRTCAAVTESQPQDTSQLSAATCRLRGHLMRFITYATQDDESNDPALDSLPGKSGHFAMGDGYVAVVVSPKTTVDDQESLATAVIKSLGGSVVDYGP